jgi:hypothetical protein
MFYGDFPSIPLILIITLEDRKTLFCVILSFGELIFYHEKHLKRKKSMR